MFVTTNVCIILHFTELKLNIIVLLFVICFFFQNGSTVLHYAASRGKLSFIRELVNHGADVNIDDNVCIFHHLLVIRFYLILGNKGLMVMLKFSTN